MLNVFRENLRHLRWVLYLVIASFVLFFGVSYRDACRQGPARGGWVAQVGGRAILPQEWSWRAQERQRFSPATARDLGELALLDLVERLLIVEAASDAGIRVANEELDAYIRTDRFLVDPETFRFVGRDDYRRIVQEGRAGVPHFSLDSFENWKRDSRMVERWAALVGAAAPSDDAFVSQVLARQSSRAQVRYLVVPAVAVPGLAEPGDAEVRAFAAAAADELQRSGFVVVFDDTTVPADLIAVSDGDIDAYMRQNPELYASPARRGARVILLPMGGGADEAAVLDEARDLADQLRQGELDFAEVARSRSAHAETRELGGDLGVRTRTEMGDLDPMVVGNLFSSVVEGATLGPLRGSEGYWILRVERIEEPVLPEVLPEGQANQIRVFLRARLLDDATNQAATAFRREVGSPGEARDRATLSGYPLHELDRLAEGQVPPELTGAAPAVAELFDLGVGELSRVVRLGQGYAVVARTESSGEAEIVDAVLEPARRALTERRAAERLGELADAARGAGGGLDQVARSLGLEVQETAGAVGFDLLESTLGGEGRRAALSSAPGSLQGPFDGPRGSVLVEVVDRPAPEPPAPGQEDQLRARTRGVLQQLLYLALLEDLRARALDEGKLIFEQGVPSDLPHRSLDTPQLLAPLTIPSSR